MTHFLTGYPQYHRRGVVSRSCSGWEGVAEVASSSGFDVPGILDIAVVQPECRGDTDGHGIDRIDSGPLGQVHRFRHRTADQDFVRRGEVLAQLARGVDLGTVDILIADAQRVAIADA